MVRTLTMKLDKIQPSQLWISAEKLAQIMKMLDKNKPESVEPVPLKKLGNDVVFVDGHTRALAAYLLGAKKVRVCWETDELDWDEYEECVRWCKEEGIRTIADLKDRVVSAEQYEVLWLKRCEKMQRELEAKRKKKVSVSRLTSAKLLIS